MKIKKKDGNKCFLSTEWNILRVGQFYFYATAKINGMGEGVGYKF